MVVFLLILVISLIGLTPLVITYLLAKKIGLKEAWVGLIVMLSILLFLSFVEITSMPASNLEESIRLYLHNDGQMVFAFFYVPALISSIISMILLVLLSFSDKRKGKN